MSAAIVSPWARNRVRAIFFGLLGGTGGACNTVAPVPDHRMKGHPYG